MRRDRSLLKTIALGSSLLLAACESAEQARGRQLFTGEQPLNGRIVGHASTLPPHAGRCVNCHADSGATPAAASSAAQGFGTSLSRDSLASLRPRRGGPPSRFDESSLCRLLRTGVDPAHVVIQRSMPRYELSDADCRALWAHLSKQS